MNKFGDFQNKFRRGFAQGYVFGKSVIRTPSTKNLAFSAGNVAGRGVKLVKIGVNKFFSTAKKFGTMIGRVITHMGMKLKVIGTTVWNGLRGFVLKVVNAVKALPSRLKGAGRKAIDKTVDFAGKVVDKVHGGYVKVADRLTRPIKKTNKIGLPKSKKKYNAQVAARNKVVNKKAYAMEGATGLLAAAGITGIVNAFNNLPSKAKEDE